MALKFEPISIKQIIRETPDAVSIVFTNPDKERFQYKPGQYLTLRLHINGKKVNRAYSLSSAPNIDSDLKVTVKVTEGGLVSTYLNREAKQGENLEVLPPLGNFYVTLSPSNQKHYILIGGGSGITPLMSILKTVLDTEPNSKVLLLYQNRSEGSIIFNSELKQLCANNPNRLEIVHSLSNPTTEIDCLKGRLSQEGIQIILSEKALLPEKEVFICGPSALMDTAFHAVKNLGYPLENIHQEHFSAPIHIDEEEDSKPSSNDGKIIDREITVIMDGKEHKVMVGKNMNVLEAALDIDLDPPYACMMGSCCTCKAKLVSGKVIMDDREGLTDEEIKQGFVLTCQSHPITDGVILNYDEV